MIKKITIWFLHLHPLSNSEFTIWRNHWANFNENLAEHFWINGLKYLEFQGKYSSGKGKIYWPLSTPEPLNWPIQTKLGTKHLLRNGIQVCLNERPRPVPREDYSDIVKTYWWLLQSSLSKYQPNLVHSILGGCIHVYTNERPFSPQKASNDSWTNVLVKS